jgi:hypothetical protein
VSGENGDWEEAYLAMSIAIGETREAALASLGAHEAANVDKLVRALSAPAKIDRARALASALVELARDIASMGLS